MTDKKFDSSFQTEYLRPKYWLSWASIICLGVLSYIPAFIRDLFVTIVYIPLSKISTKQKKIVHKNLELAFPEKTPEEREKIYQDFLRVGLKVILGYGECFFRSKNYIRKTFKVTGEEYLKEALSLKKPIIFMAPHAWAIDHCGLYLSSIGLTMCTMMHTSKNEVYDWFMNSMRLKYGGKVYERNAGIKSIVKALKDGNHSFFLPDQDLGASKSTVFVPFYAQEKCTLVVLPKLAHLANAIVVPMFSCYNEEERKYEVVFDHYFENYPSENIVDDVTRMNKAIENEVLTREKQYMWFLKIYKTQSDGHSVY